MKQLAEALRTAPIEAYIILMLVIVAIGSVVSIVVERHGVPGDGTFIGADVRDRGTNPWQ